MKPYPMQVSESGFTLTELVTVIVIAGILSAIVYNRISITSFSTSGYTSEVRSEVRYAHKLAVAQRRNVYVSVAGNAVSLCYDSACTTAVTQPASSAAFSLSAPGVTPAIPTPFYFDSLGRPHVTSTMALAAAAVTVSITGDVMNTITIEVQTGYVH